MASLAGHEESVEAFSFLFFSLQTFLHRRHSCSRPVVPPYGIAAIASASAPSPSSSPSRCICLQTLPLLGINLFSSKIPPGPGLLTRDPRKRVPCLVQRFPRPPPVAQHAPIAIYLHASSAALHVLRNCGNPRRGLGTGAGGQTGVCCRPGFVKTGERGISLRRLQLSGKPLVQKPASSCTVGHCPTKHARPHAPIQQNHAWSPYPPRQTHALHPEVDAPVIQLLALLLWCSASGTAFNIHHLRLLAEISPQSGSPSSNFNLFAYLAILHHIEATASPIEGAHARHVTVLPVLAPTGGPGWPPWIGSNGS